MGEKFEKWRAGGLLQEYSFPCGSLRTKMEEGEEEEGARGHRGDSNKGSSLTHKLYNIPCFCV